MTDEPVALYLMRTIPDLFVCDYPLCGCGPDADPGACNNYGEGEDEEES